MKEEHEKEKTPLWRKIAGIALIVIGILALVTPFTPGSWLIFVGAEIVGFQLLSRERALRYYERVREWWSGKK